ncbi:polymorphic toxin type 8 domain-containing protein [Chromatiaceae bacterium AAb-1]|nr:polymorphic toxin type 8 domain-containing protein [Chromatiaceae bacterium AAb-1]
MHNFQYNAQVTDRRRYDAFGKPQGATENSPLSSRLENLTLSRKGFTDHRHLDEVELIHMNGRGYDYNLGRFLSVDPFIQSPGNSQSLNPYSYIMNNPLAGTDPTGYVSCAASKIERVCDNTISRWGGNGNADMTAFATSSGVASNQGNGAQVAQSTQASGVQSSTTDLLNQNALVNKNNNTSPSGLGEQFDPFASGPLDMARDWLFDNVINPLPDIQASIASVREGDYSSAVMSMAGIVGKKVEAIGKAGSAIVDAGSSAVKVVTKSLGRTGKQERLRELVDNDKLGSADRGWLKQEMNSIERGQRKTIRNPPGKDLAHERGREAAKGYGYEHSNLQDRDLHRLQHKYDNFGKKNKERP